MVETYFSTLSEEQKSFVDKILCEEARLLIYILRKEIVQFTSWNRGNAEVIAIKHTQKSPQ